MGCILIDKTTNKLGRKTVTSPFHPNVNFTVNFHIFKARVGYGQGGVVYADNTISIPDVWTAICLGMTVVNLQLESINFRDKNAFYLDRPMRHAHLMQFSDPHANAIGDRGVSH